MKHPHGRGEDKKTTTWLNCIVETPPRAWGRLINRRNSHHVCGNTPTGVGKTKEDQDVILRLEKHPHGRGEDPLTLSPWPWCLETPPRAWGRHFFFTLTREKRRNTPTGVGKTTEVRQQTPTQGKHPHGRGEDYNQAQYCNTHWETPPRAWGRLLKRHSP